MTLEKQLAVLEVRVNELATVVERLRKWRDHDYADDRQVYFNLPDDIAEAKRDILELEKCIVEIKRALPHADSDQRLRVVEQRGAEQRGVERFLPHAIAAILGLAAIAISYFQTRG